MKNGEVVREALLNNTIRLIGESGFEAATTKAIVTVPDDTSVRINEVYIYRLFGSKESLYESAFVLLDRELTSAFKRGAIAVGGFREDTKERLYEFFLRSWDFLLGNEARCRCYLRYYHSVYFKGKSLEEHKRIFSDIISEMQPLFKEEADVVSILHGVFTALFDFAIRVYNGDLDDNDINRPHIFNVLYCMMSSYFADDIKAS